ncbi:MAG: hypothetical protein Q9219_003509 [cf. Caloplaca sp. 3 TL-2023]
MSLYEGQSSSRLNLSSQDRLQRARIRALERQVRELTTELQATKDDLQTTEAKLQTTEADLQRIEARLEERIATLSKERSILEDELDEAAAKTRQLQHDLRRARTENSGLKLLPQADREYILMIAASMQHYASIPLAQISIAQRTQYSVASSENPLPGIGRPKLGSASVSRSDFQSRGITPDNTESIRSSSPSQKTAQEIEQEGGFPNDKKDTGPLKSRWPLSQLHKGSGRRLADLEKLDRDWNDR